MTDRTGCRGNDSYSPRISPSKVFVFTAVIVHPTERTTAIRGTTRAAVLLEQHRRSVSDTIDPPRHAIRSLVRQTIGRSNTTNYVEILSRRHCSDTNIVGFRQ